MRHPARSGRAIHPADGNRHPSPPPAVGRDWLAAKRVHLAVLAAAIVAGCAGHQDDQAGCMYLWNESDRALGYVPTPQGTPPEYGVIATGKQTIGCTWRKRGWWIAILDSPASPVSDGTALAQVSSADYPAP